MIDRLNVAILKIVMYCFVCRLYSSPSFSTFIFRGFYSIHYIEHSIRYCLLITIYDVFKNGFNTDFLFTSQILTCYFQVVVMLRLSVVAQTICATSFWLCLLFWGQPCTRYFSLPRRQPSSLFRCWWAERQNTLVPSSPVPRWTSCPLSICWGAALSLTAALQY